MSEMLAALFRAPGKPDEVVELARVPAPRPAANEVLVRVAARPLHPADFMFIGGRYRIRPQLPQVAGLEGAGEVVAAGDASGVAVGTRVAFRSPGTWAELVAVPADKLFVVPSGVAMDDASQFSLNPVTAWGLLDDAGVRDGDVLAINAATSGVASIVHGLARSRGIRTVGIVRETNAAANALPFPVAAASSPTLADDVLALAGGAPIAAYLDSVGGPLVKALVPALRTGATIVSYGVLGQGSSELGNVDMIYRNLTWKGFGVDHWLSRSADKRERMTTELWRAIANGAIALPVRARHRLGDVAAAIADASAAGRTGKVLIADEQ